jgi:hypothetical protein
LFEGRVFRAGALGYNQRELPWYWAINFLASLKGKRDELVIQPYIGIQDWTQEVFYEKKMHLNHVWYFACLWPACAGPASSRGDTQGNC